MKKTPKVTNTILGPFLSRGLRLEAFFYMFRAPSQRGFSRIWKARRRRKQKPFGIMFEALAENLKAKVFEDHSIDWAVTGTKHGSLFASIFSTVVDLPFWGT